MPTAPETLTLGERLRALIEKKRGPIEPGNPKPAGGGIAGVARDAGISQAHLKHILAGTAMPRQAMLERILAALGSNQTELWS